MKKEWKQKALKLENKIQNLKNKVNYNSVIEGHTAESTKMWREHKINLV